MRDLATSTINIKSKTEKAYPKEVKLKLYLRQPRLLPSSQFLTQDSPKIIKIKGVNAFLISNKCARIASKQKFAVNHVKLDFRKKYMMCLLIIKLTGIQEKKIGP